MSEIFNTVLNGFVARNRSDPIRKKLLTIDIRSAFIKMYLSPLTLTNEDSNKFTANVTTQNKNPSRALVKITNFIHNIAKAK
jgi:hypothetical protein